MNYVQVPDEVLPKVRNWSAMQLAIWADVHTMNKAGMTYYRTNEQLAERWGADDRTVRRVVAQLIACGAVTAEQDGKRRILVATASFAEKRRTNRSPDQSVPGPISPRTNRSAKEDQLVRYGGPTGPQKEDQLVPQVEHIVEQREEQEVEKSAHWTETIFEAEIVDDTTTQKPVAPTTNSATQKRKPKEREIHDVVLPFDTDSFSAAWREWLDYKWAQHRFAYKRQQDEQTALHHLQKNSNGNEQLAIDIIASSIANGYRGLFASNTKKSNLGAGSRSGSYFHSSGKYEHPADVLKDRDIWG